MRPVCLPASLRRLWREDAAARVAPDTGTALCGYFHTNGLTGAAYHFNGLIEYSVFYLALGNNSLLMNIPALTSFLYAEGEKTVFLRITGAVLY